VPINLRSVWPIHGFQIQLECDGIILFHSKSPLGHETEVMCSPNGALLVGDQVENNGTFQIYSTPNPF